MQAENLRVLVVDDHEGQRQLLRSMIEALGVMAVTEAASGHAAIEAMIQADELPDLVITDLNMRDGDGFDVLRAASSLAIPPQIVIVSAVEQEVLAAVDKLRAHAQAIPVVAIAKPITLDRLRDVIQNTCNQTRRVAATRALPIEDIARGIVAREFVAFLEPKLNLQTGQVTGFEALARWRHPVHGLVGPAAFIPVIESTPSMLAFTLALFDDVLATRKRLQAEGFRGTISVNFGAACLSDDSFPAGMEAGLCAAGLADGEGITLELTESSGIHSMVDAVSGLTRLRLLGFQLALDDFGMGFSSLASMRNGAFSEIKIDREFTSRLLTDRLSRAAVESIISIANSLGWRCVAEGIETPAVLNVLASMGCETGQGYLFSQPIDPRYVVTWLQRWDPARAVAQDSPAAPAIEQAVKEPNGRFKPVDARQLLSLEQRDVPAWMFDLEDMRMRWANTAALRFWQVDSLEELIARDFQQDMTAAARERLMSYRERLADGKLCTERFTLYPLGVPTQVDCIMSGVLTSDGHRTLIVEAFGGGSLVESMTFEAEGAMASAALITVMDESGRVLWRNPSASRSLGVRRDHFDALLTDQALARRLLTSTINHGDHAADAQVHTPDGLRWHRLQLRTARDPRNGDGIIVCTQMSIDDLVKTRVN